MTNKKCYGNYTYCTDKETCKIKDKCLKKEIEIIREKHLGLELSKRVKEQKVNEEK